VYTPDAETLPLIFAKNKLGAGYSGMIDAEIWFVNRQPLPTQPWQAAEKEKLKIPAGLHSASVSFTAGGTIGITIKDAGSFLQNTEPSGSSYTSAQAFDLIKKDFFTALPKMLAAKMQKDSIDAGGLTAPYDALAGFCMHYFNEHMMPVSGYRLSAFTIDNIKILSPAAPAPKPEVKAPAADASSTAANIGCGIIVAVVVVLLVVFYRFASRQASQDDAKKAKGLQALYEARKVWDYSETKNEDSVVTGRMAMIASDQSLEIFRTDTYDNYKHDVSLALFQNYNKYGSDSSVDIFVPENHSVKPFAMKRSRIVMLRFDSDTTMSLSLENYSDYNHTLSLPHPGVLIPRLKKSHKLTVMLTSTAHPDSTVQYTFHTAGLKWGGTN
jgi:hypothetical protein